MIWDCVVGTIREEHRINNMWIPTGQYWAPDTTMVVRLDPETHRLTRWDGKNWVPHRVD